MLLKENCTDANSDEKKVFEDLYASVSLAIQIESLDRPLVVGGSIDYMLSILG